MTFSEKRCRKCTTQPILKYFWCRALPVVFIVIRSRDGVMGYSRSFKNDSTEHLVQIMRRTLGNLKMEELCIVLPVLVCACLYLGRLFLPPPLYKVSDIGKRKTPNLQSIVDMHLSTSPMLVSFSCSLADMPISPHAS